MPDDHRTAQSSDTETAAPLRVAQRTRAELLAEALATRIRDEGFTPGSAFATLDGLRAETGHAYSTVSEAVRLLRDRGVLEIRPGRNGGLFVAHSGPLVRLRQTLLEVGEAPTEVADVIELREHLEMLIDVSAARHRSTHDIADLKRSLEALEVADSWDDFMHANWALHERIALICPNQLARAVYLATLGRLGATRARLDSEADGYRRRRVKVHADLVAAIIDGDDDRVRRVVRRHNGTT